MNTVTLIGRLGQDIEIKATGSGLSVANFSIAMNSKVKGEDHTTWLKCTAFGELADNLAASAGKGDRLIVQGRLQEKEWTTRDGDTRKSMEFILDDAGVALRWSRNGGGQSTGLPLAAQPDMGGDPF